MRREGLWAIAAALLVAACGQRGVGGASQAQFRPRALMSAQLAADRREPAENALAREHTAVVELSEAALDTAFHRVLAACAADAANQCAVLNADVSSGKSAAGRVRVRIDPPGVEPLIATAAAVGTLARRSSTAEDLAAPIADTATRLAMLTAYRKQLGELQLKSASNIDAALKVAAELSRVQSELEGATAQAANLHRRVATELVTIEFVVPVRAAPLRPVREALADFAEDFAAGAGQAITVLAYAVPWLLVIVPSLWLVRFLWRRRRR